MPNDRRERAGSTLLRWSAASVILGLCLLWLHRQLELPALGGALATADSRLVALMTAVHLVLFVSIKAWRWRVVLAPTRRLTLSRLYQYCLAGYAVTNLLPMRAGLAARVALVRRDGVPVASAVGSLVVEEICNSVVLGALCLPLLFLHAPSSRVRLVVELVTVGAALALGILVLVARAGGRSASTHLRRLSEGVRVLGQGGGAGLVLALTVAMWVVDLGQIALAMSAVGVSPSYTGVALVLLFVNLTHALPATPGHVGLFEAATAAACLAVGAAPAQAVAVGVLYHLMQLVPETVIGMCVLGGDVLVRGSQGDAAT